MVDTHLLAGGRWKHWLAGLPATRSAKHSHQHVQRASHTRTDLSAEAVASALAWLGCQHS